MTSPLRHLASLPAAVPPPSPAAPAGAGTSVMLPVAGIDPAPWRPRHSPAALDLEDDRRLTASIARHGVQENLLVRPIAGDRHQVLFGERRLRCAIAASCTEVPAIARALDDRQALVLVLTEHLRRQRLHFLDESDAIARLVAERWTLPEIAADLGRPLSWAVRRHRLQNLTAAWRELAARPAGFLAHWSVADFEEVAVLEPQAQDDLLTRDRRRLERCTTVRDLAQLVRSLARPVAGFPWSPDDADLHPLAGACSSCPHRSSQHPGLLDPPPADDARGPSSAANRFSPRPPDRCLDPVCAAAKAQLYLERRTAELAAKHPRVVLLQEGWLLRDIPGALHDWEVSEVPRRTRGALPAVVANGANLGDVRWIRLRDPQAARPVPLAAAGPPRERSLAQRQARTRRRQQILALRLLKLALHRRAAPALAVSVRLAIVFGTAQANVSAASTHDDALPLLIPGMDPARERRRMLRSAVGDDLDDALDLPAATSAPPGSRRRHPTRAAAHSGPARDLEPRVLALT